MRSNPELAWRVTSPKWNDKFYAGLYLPTGAVTHELSMDFWDIFDYNGITTKQKLPAKVAQDEDTRINILFEFKNNIVKS